MSSSSKAILWIVIVVVVAGGAWWYLGSRKTEAPSTQTNSANTAAATLSQGSSNQNLAQDLTKIDAQMNGLSSDSASVSQSVNDQPIQ